jgi:sarcosine oxidase, subunit gamma
MAKAAKAAAPLMPTASTARAPVLAGRRYAKGRTALSVAPPAIRISLRAPQASVAALSKALEKAIGVKLPLAPKTSTLADGAHVMWLGPDEWLIVAPAGSISPDVFAKIGAFHAAVDVSHRNAALIVEGTGAADALNAGCPQDLSPAVFPVGACSRTLLGKTEIVLLSTAPDAFRVEVWRSFAPYAFDFLEDAIRRDC